MLYTTDDRGILNNYPAEPAMYYAESPSVVQLSDEQEDYLEEFLHQVSRSFALVIPCLDKPLDVIVGTAYLLCRVADNIEDCQQPFEWQQARFAEFYRLLQEPNLAPNILCKWSHEQWPSLTNDERRLMESESGVMLWQIYSLMPSSVANIVCRWVSRLAKGMEYMLAPESPMVVIRNGVRLPATKSDFDHYCYFVAGTVGYMGTELAIDHYHLGELVAQSLRMHCESCGRALQKINIIKDFPEDLARGVCYLPDKWMKEIDGLPLTLGGAPKDWTRNLLSDLMAELSEAVYYVTTIPYSAPGYRQFCLRSLLIAYQTLLVAAQQHDSLFTPNHQVKISRRCLLECVEDARSMGQDNDLLINYSQKLQNSINSAL